MELIDNINRLLGDDLKRALKPGARLKVMDHLSFEISEGDDGVTTLDAMASTPAAQHAAVMAEAQQVLDWAWQHFPHTHGPVDEGQDWDHELQILVEEGGWHTVSLTLTASPRVVEAFLAVFGAAED